MCVCTSSLEQAMEVVDRRMVPNQCKTVEEGAGRSQWRMTRGPPSSACFAARPCASGSLPTAASSCSTCPSTRSTRRGWRRATSRALVPLPLCPLLRGPPPSSWTIHRYGMCGSQCDACIVRQKTDRS
ncbi:hypothetical protein I4F81_011357 [Pyropia yezoensis]|uniref:Uncharacterized protein n=1 Tax=Pyropia yezoensis TaxID=2788 RepID=A0ACC3CF86_PYRYE|nr:hypothetical protein I4F81_011357 [Neopyropia yezoensis]